MNNSILIIYTHNTHEDAAQNAEEVHIDLTRFLFWAQVKVKLK